MHRAEIPYGQQGTENGNLSGEDWKSERPPMNGSGASFASTGLGDPLEGLEIAPDFQESSEGIGAVPCKNHDLDHLPEDQDL